jgi:RNA polymerase sigma-70 factor (ECF subfamily)
VHDAPEVIDADAVLLEGLRAGDEAAFTELVDRYSSSMLRVARMYVPSQAVAEEVVQETWLGVLTGLERFEGRSSLKTWLFRILVNRARTRGERD